MFRPLTESEMKCLSRIKTKFGKFFAQAGTLYGFNPAILAGICMRESRGGEILDSNMLGDAGHGHGLMQIDDRSYPEFCADPTLYKNPVTNILQGCAILREMRTSVRRICDKFSLDPPPDIFERMYVAAYNCGANSPVHAFRVGKDIDTYTTGRDYSAAVESYAVFYANDPTPEGDSETKQYSERSKYSKSGQIE